MKTIPLFAAALLAHGLFAAATPVYDDDTTPTVMTVTVAEGADTLDVAIPATVTKFIKLGAGKLTLTQAALWAKNAGTVEVQAGTLDIGAYANMGDPAKVVVSQDATLDFTGLAANLYETSYFQTVFEVKGNGCNGAGALRYTATDKKNHALLKFVTMTGDTKIVGPSYTAALSQDNGWGVGQCTKLSPAVPCLDMGGHTLTVEGSYCFGNSSDANMNKVSNPGNIIVLENARLLLASMNTLTVDGTGATTQPTPNGKTITLNNNSKMLTYMVRHAPTLTWTVVVPKDVWADYYFLNNSDNERRGNIYTPFEVEGTLAVREYSSCSQPLHFLSPITGGGKIVHFTEVSSSANATVDARVEVMDGFSVGSLNVERGTMTFKDAGIVSVTNLYCHSGTLYGAAETVIGRCNVDDEKCDNYISRLRLTGNTHFGGVNASPSNHAIMVGCDKYGILDISGGATVSNMIYMARKNGDYGAVWLSGATSEIWWPATEYNRSLIGDVGYGCMMMSGGKVTMTGKTVLLGRNGGSGYWFQTGGTTEVRDDYFWLARPNGSYESTADLHVQGGSFEAKKNIRCLFPDEGDSWSGARAVITVGGGATPALLKTRDVIIYCSQSEKSSSTVINVNSNGTFAAEKIYREMSPNKAGHTWEDGSKYTQTHVFLNFNGGTLRFASKQAEFFSAETRKPERTLVYAGGATFDTDGHDVGFAAPLVKPFGKGIASVTIPDAYLGTKDWFIGASRLIGNYTSFSAITDFDTATRSVKGAIITSPSCGWPENGTVSVLDRTRNKRVCAITLEDVPTTGGVTKKGAGTLTLKGENTYGGTTRIEGGTLAFAHADGLPGGDIEFSSEAVAAATPGAPLLVANTLKLDAGKKIRITGVDQLTADAFGRMRTLVSVTTPMAAMPAVELVDSNGQTVSTGDWHFSLSADGKTLKFGRSIGFCVLFR